MSCSEPIQLSNYINGQFVASEGTFASFNPSTGEVNAFIPNSDKAAVERAVEAAKKAFPM